MGELREAIGSWAQKAAKNAGWIVALGVLTVIAGFMAMGSPLASGLVVVVIIGIAMTIAGVARTIGAFSAGSFGQGALAFIGGILTFGAGLVLAARPGIGLATLTLLLGGYLLVDGISSAVLAFHVRPEKGWGFMLFSAVMGVILGFLLLREWPLSGVWAIGTLVGVNMLFSGFSMISVGSAARGLAKKLE
ncbi:MAG: HdeD family acid-resistance protein [Vicinamibacteria bacterium]